MPIIARPNRDALSRGLDIYRDTMRPFVLRCLEMVPGAPDEVIRRILPPRQIEDFDRDRQRAADLASAIDVNLFPKLGRAYWGMVFQSRFNGNSLAQEHMTKIKHARNEVAHPPTADLTTGYAREHLGLISALLGRIGAFEEQRAVEDLINRDDDAPSSPRPDPLQPPPASEYHVYTDIPTRRSRVHRADCQYYRNRKEDTLDDNYWHGPYSSIEAASEANISDPDTRWDALPCGHCRP